MTSVTFTSIDGPDGSRIVFATVDGQRVITVSSRLRPASARVLLIHGLGDHPARHLTNARRLAARGYTTLILELAGHGGSAGEWSRTMPIYEAYARTDRSADQLRAFQSEADFPAALRRDVTDRQYRRLLRTDVADHLVQISAVLRHLDEAMGTGAGLPVFVVGHSLGGLLAHETVSRMAPADRAAVAGVVLIAPAFAPQGNPDSPAMRLALNGLWELRRLPLSPTRTAAKALLGLNFGVDTTWGKKWLNDIPLEVELFGTDPLVPHRLPTRYASTIESLMADSARRDPRLPYDGLVLLPRRDGITSREAAVRFARRANTVAGTTRVSLAEFDVVAHDLLRSSARERVLSTIGDWMDGRLRQRTPDAAAHSRAS